MIHVVPAIQFRILFDDLLVSDLKLTPYADLTARDVSPCPFIPSAAVISSPMRHCLFDLPADVAQVVRQVIRVQCCLYGHHPATNIHPTAAGMIAPLVGMTLPTVAPMPQWTSGM